ncbi:membrane protein [Caballeronia sordidicola]|uniref:Membrane protein n=1 Tax=Caballeronia sordidicola TaxID=196367 RepID=A0A158GTG4_CABSO|nr:hypothetical protein [Caballeronia sordidicola]SAL34730.1 membrane protein [Caballeronia sordidicola]
MQHVWAFFVGALVCNCVPHLASGLQGLAFPTPFARPRGVGNSPPLVNVIWGFANLAIAFLIAAHNANSLDMGPDAAAGLAGGLAIGIYLSLHFGKVQRNRRAD